MNDPAANPSAPELAGSKHDEGWSRTRWLVVIVLIFATHVALIFSFGERKEPAPRIAKDFPKLNFADQENLLVALNDPTLFALPQPKDFTASAAWKMPDLKQLPFRWTEPPRPLPLATDDLGAAFNQFLETNSFAGHPLDFTPAVEFGAPVLEIEPAPAQNSTLQIQGGLAQRQLPFPISLTNWPYADVLAPCVVQALVGPAGNVISAAILSPSGYAAADQRALELTRDLHFTPSPQPVVGRIIFNWQTVPVVPPTATP